jgi:Uma2 family endonuclease
VTRQEYYRGEIFAMAGASLVHNRITLNLLTALRVALRAGPCEAFGSDLRIGTPRDSTHIPTCR